MSKFVFKRKGADSELPLSIGPELANMKIRICTDGYPETGALYYEGTVRKFIIERQPHPTLISLLPQLLTEAGFTYQPSTEKLRIERIDG